jgi:hypothetical protein
MSETRRFTVLIDPTEKGAFVVAVRNVKTDEEKSWILPEQKIGLFLLFGGVAGEAVRFLFGEAPIAVDKGISYLQTAMARQRQTRIRNRHATPAE